MAAEPETADSVASNGASEATDPHTPASDGASTVSDPPPADAPASGGASTANGPPPADVDLVPKTRGSRLPPLISTPALPDPDPPIQIDNGVIKAHFPPGYDSLWEESSPFAEHLLHRLLETGQLPPTLADAMPSDTTDDIERSTELLRDMLALSKKSMDLARLKNETTVKIVQEIQSLCQTIEGLDKKRIPELVRIAGSKRWYAVWDRGPHYNLPMADVVARLDNPDAQPLSHGFVKKYGQHLGSKRALIASIIGFVTSDDVQDGDMLHELEQELIRVEFDSRCEQIMKHRATWSHEDVTIEQLLVRILNVASGMQWEQLPSGRFPLAMRLKLHYVLDHLDATKDGCLRWYQPEHRAEVQNLIEEIRDIDRVKLNDIETVPNPADLTEEQREVLGYHWSDVSSHSDWKNEEKDLKTHWRKFDSNGDKVMTADEVGRFHDWWVNQFVGEAGAHVKSESQNAMVSMSRASLMEKIDTNKDGTISSEEFAAFWKTARARIELFKQDMKIRVQMKECLVDLLVGPSNFEELDDPQGYPVPRYLRYESQHSKDGKDRTQHTADWMEVEAVSFELITGISSLRARATSSHVHKGALVSNMQLSAHLVNYAEQRNALIWVIIHQETKRSCNPLSLLTKQSLSRKHKTLNDAELELAEITQLKVQKTGMEKFEGKKPLACCDCFFLSTNSMLQILFTWTGTVLPMAMGGMQMWFSILIYWFTRFAIRSQIAEEVFPPLEQQGVGILGQFLSFFLVFYASQAYARFNAQYGTSCACKARILDVCTVAKSVLEPEAALRLMRYVNAAHALAYVGLSEAYTMDNFYDTLFPTGRLLTEKELNVVNKLNPDTSGPAAFHEVIAWALHDVIAQTSAQTVTYTGPQVLKKALESQSAKALEDRASKLDIFVEDGLDREHLIQRIVAKAAKENQLVHRMDNIEHWNSKEVSAWIDGIQHVGASSCGKRFQESDVHGRELLRLTRRDIFDILNAVDENDGTKPKGVVVCTKRILASIERVRGDDIRLSDSVAHEVIELILQLRASLTSLFGFKNQPIPFFYVHLLLTISVFYLPLFAYSVALDFGQLDAMCSSLGTAAHEPAVASNTDGSADITADGDAWASQWSEYWSNFCGSRLYYEAVGTICIFLQNIVVIGLTQAGERMSDPYGDDEVDLPARQFVSKTLQASRRLLEASPTIEAPSKESEEAVLDNEAAADVTGSEEEDDEDTGSSPKPNKRSGSGRRLGKGGSGQKLVKSGSGRRLGV